MKSVFNSYLLKGGFAAFCLSAGLMMACDGGSSKADIPTPPPGRPKSAFGKSLRVLYYR